MALIDDKFDALGHQLDGQLPENIVSIIVDNARRHSSKRVHPQWTQEALEAIGREWENGKIWAVPVDAKGFALLNIALLDELGVGIALPDAVYAKSAAPHATVPLSEVEAGRGAGDMFFCFTGEDNANFFPDRLDLPKGTHSLFDTIVYQRLSLRRIVEQINAPSERPRVLFVGGVPMYNFSRQVGGLEIGGIECRLLTIQVDHDNYPVDGFSVLAHANGSIADFFHLVRHADVECIHVYCTMNLYYQGMVTKLLSRCPLVFEFNDVSSFFYPRFNFEYLYGKDNMTLEEYAEKFVCQHMNGMIVQSEEVANYQRRSYGELPNYLVFPPRPLETAYRETRHRDESGPFHLVYAGVVAPSCQPRELYGDIQMREVFGSLLDQGFRLDVYTNDVMNFGAHYEEYRFLAAKNSTFSMYPRIHPDTIGKVLGRYHYGLMVYDFSMTTVGWRHLETIFPTKLMTYVEAGLPIIISRELAAAAQFVEDNGLGLVLPEGGFRAVIDLVQASPYGEILERFECGRKTIGITREIPRLVAYYGDVMKRHAAGAT